MTEGNILRLLAPVSGKTVPIESVPDAVFAQKTVGDGIAIAPSSYVLCAPCAGKVSTIHSAHHALTLSAAGGIDILMHIGLDTVMLKGEGFEVFVIKGQTVEAGQPLIAFSREILESRGKSLLTEIVVASLEKTDGLKPYVNRDVTVGKDTVLEVKLKAAAKEESAQSAHTATSWQIGIKNPAGLHARPAAVLVAAAKEFSADIALMKDDREANAKSVVAVMGLDIAQGDKVRLKASGTDAAEALKKLIPLLENGLGEDLTKAPDPAVPAVEKQTGKAGAFYGVPASKGVALGVVVQLKDVSIDVEEFGGQIADEKEKLNAALNEARFVLNDLYDKTAAKTGAESAAIFKAHEELLDDPDYPGFEPRCVEACPNQALVFGDLADPESNISKLIAANKVTQLECLGDMGSSVVHLNIPSRFLAGTVAYPQELEEVCIGAKVKITNEASGEVCETETNWAGDYEFENLPKNASYTVEISFPGFKPVVYKGERTDVDHYVGITYLEKE